MMRTAARPEKPEPDPASNRTAREARLLSLVGHQVPGSRNGTPTLTAISDATLDRWLASLERYDRACGCKSGAAFGLLALISWPLVAIRRHRARTPRGLVAALGIWAAVSVIGALAGKLGGLAVAGVARRSLIRRIAANVSRELAQGSSPAAAGRR